MIRLGSLLNLLLILYLGNAFGQVGIGTDNPKGDLEIAGNPADPEKVDGVFFPRLSGIRLKAKDNVYTSDHQGVIVYVQEGLDPNQLTPETEDDVSSKTIHVTQEGFYCFSGSEWIPLSVEPWHISPNERASLNTQNIYQLGSVGIGTDEFPNSEVVKLNIYNETTDQNTTHRHINLKNSLSSNQTQALTGIENKLVNTSTTNQSQNHYGIHNELKEISSNTGKTTGIYNDFQINYSNKTNHESFGIQNLVSVSGGTFNNGTKNFTGLHNLGFYTPTVTSEFQNTTNIDNIFNISPIGAIELNFDNVRVLNNHTTLNQNQIGFENNINTTLGINTLHGIDNVISSSTNQGSNLGIGFLKGIYSEIDLGGFGRYNIQNLYGLHIAKNNTNLGGINTRRVFQSYGIYIDEFRFEGDSSGNSYNFYSEGSNTKNYFGGKVGIKKENPQAPLHITNGSEITPVIIENLPIFNDNASASAANIPVGGLYRTSTGDLKVRY